MEDARAFYALYEGLERLGPGSADETRRALGLTGLSGPLEVLDMGAGTGAQSLVLLEALPEALVTAVDSHAPFLKAAARRVAAAGFSDRFAVLHADMADPPFTPGTVDLLWCEGAVYHLGVTEALRAWRPLLSPRGVVVFSEPVWTVARPDPEVEAAFAGYPAMTHARGVRERIEAAGYLAAGGFLLREAAWDAYYRPLAARERSLREAEGDNPALAEARAEIALRRRFRHQYGYAMFLARPRQAA
ncbi:MAG TPA: class I SAM-dependent methyltransferase [Paracoccaceae bacterium]|nr:class I SAM-dependent methyltransferase [Paracoccaceae bacterium]